jgi:hypothetical protein
VRTRAAITQMRTGLAEGTGLTGERSGD